MSAAAPTLVLIGGWSWHRHVGDDAILRAHLEEIRRELPGHFPMVVCGEPERLAERWNLSTLWTASPALVSRLNPDLSHEEVTSAHLLPAVDDVVAAALQGRAATLPALAALTDAIASADAVIAASAGSLTGAYPLTVAEQVVALRIAQAMGKPTVVSGASLGPFGTTADEDLLRAALAGADVVSLRDATVSPARAKELGVAPAKMTIQPDPAFWMTMAPDAEATGALRRSGVDPARGVGLLTVAPRPGGPDQGPSLAAAVQAVSETAGTAFVGVPMYLPPVGGDEVALDGIRARLSGPDRLRRLEPLPDDPVLLALSGRADVVVGSRFHGAVLAAAAGTPSVLVYDGDYQRDKAESLAAAVPAVQAVPLAAGPDAIATATLAQMASPVPPFEPSGPLAAVRWLAESLARRKPRSRRRWPWPRRRP